MARAPTEVSFSQQVPVNHLLLVLGAQKMGKSSIQEALISPLSKQYFKEMQEIKLTVRYTLEKYTVILLTTSLTLSVPLVSAYLIYSKYAASLLKDQFALTIAGVTIPAMTLTTCIAVNELTRRMLGFNPVEKCVDLCRSLTTFAVAGVAYATYQSYEKKEKNTEEHLKVLHKKMIEDQKNLYQFASIELEHRFKSALNHPDEMFLLKHFAQDIQSQLTLIYEKVFSKFGISRAEGSEILSPLADTLIAIRENQLCFRTGKAAENHAYNTTIFLTLPNEELLGAALSNQALQNLSIASHIKLDWRHKVSGISEGVAKSVLAGLTTFVAAPTILFLMAWLSSKAGQPAASVFFNDKFILPLKAPLDNLDKNALILPAVSGTFLAAGSFFVASQIFKRTLDRIQRERQEKVRLQFLYAKEVFKELNLIYDGIASELKIRTDWVDKRNEVKQKFEIIERVLKENQISDTDAILKKLRSVIF